MLSAADVAVRTFRMQPVCSIYLAPPTHACRGIFCLFSRGLMMKYKTFGFSPVLLSEHELTKALVRNRVSIQPEWVEMNGPNRTLTVGWNGIRVSRAHQKRAAIQPDHLVSGILGNVVGGWTVATVTTLQSGAPFTVITQTNSTNAFSSGSLRADVLSGPNLPFDQRSVQKWFDTGAFAQPGIYQFGNQGRNILCAPGLINVDASLLRDFKFTEHKTFQIRGEFLNSTNHTNLGIPNSTFGSSGSGTMTSSGPARQIQLGARFEF
jgi:hypothetical protein